MTALLRVRHLSTSFKTEAGLVRAVDDVSFDLAEGETLGLVGESGSGKTVTALSILRLIPQPPGAFGPESRIEYDGVDLLRLPARELRKVRGAQIAMIFQEPMSSLNPVLTVGSQISEAIRAHEPVSRREANGRAVELLDLVGIPEPERRFRDYPHQMSGGMQQRVMIGMALSCRPKILIADEPTTALDVTIQAQILDLMRGLQAEFGMAIIFITHDLGVVAQIADEVAIMYMGRIIEKGSVGEIFHDPKHPYTINLIRAIPTLGDLRVRRQLVPIRGAVPSLFERPAGCAFHPRCDSFMAGRCDAGFPELTEITPRHDVRCFLNETAGIQTAS